MTDGFATITFKKKKKNSQGRNIAAQIGDIWGKYMYTDLHGKK